MQLPKSLPVHLELASMANANFVTQLLSKVISENSIAHLNQINMT